MVKFSLYILPVIFSWTVSAQMPILRPLPRNVSQSIVIDSGDIRVLYALNATDISKPETYDDLQRLEIGANLSKYYSFYTYNSDSLVTDWGKKNLTAQSTPTRMGVAGKDGNWSEHYYTYMYKYYSDRVLKSYICMPMWMRSDYQLLEVLPVQNWELFTEKQTIAGYLCQKASCRFKGRNFTAWFSADIPISSGPWKFGGLPGLILKVYDDDLFYVYECVGIEKHKSKFPIYQYDDKLFVKTERKKLLKLINNIHEDFARVVGAVYTPKEGMVQKPSPPYHLLELE